MNIKKSINVACAQRGWSKKQLAEKMQVTRQRISNIGQQKSPRHETVEKLANAFGLKASEFIALGEDN